MVTLALSQPTMLGLSSAQAKALAPLVSKRYELMAASPSYSKLSSHLPYCYSAVRPTRGAAYVQIPVGASPKSPTIVFLHGYGGSFVWYIHWLAESLPDHVIVAPAYGISPAEIPADYLAEAMDAASAKVGFILHKPTLVGLSAGGFGACRAFLKAPDRFGGLLCLGAFPPEDTVRRFTRTQRVRFIVGGRESFVVSGHLRSLLKTIQFSCPAADLTIIPEADHFFMLSHPDETRKALRTAFPASN